MRLFRFYYQTLTKEPEDILKQHLSCHFPALSYNHFTLLKPQVWKFLKIMLGTKVKIFIKSRIVEVYTPNQSKAFSILSQNSV